MIQSRPYSLQIFSLVPHMGSLDGPIASVEDEFGAGWLVCKDVAVEPQREVER